MRHLSIFLTGFLLVGCSMSQEAQIKEAIAEANHCEVKEDCELVGSKCPFDCYIYANVSEAERIRTMVEGYQSTCQYSCIQSQGVDCVENKCVAITDMPIADSPEGNVGTVCTSDSECVTPMDYMIRSSCPFTSKCVEGSCAVACPMIEDVDPVAGQTFPVSCNQDSDCDCGGYVANDMGRCACVNNQCFALIAE